MNSIKNAFVTVTMLAVGYGSYIVLSEPQAGENPAGPGYSNTLVDGGGALPALEVDQQPSMVSPEDMNRPSAPRVEMSSGQSASLSPAPGSFSATLAEQPRSQSITAPDLASAGQPSGRPDLPPLPALIGESVESQHVGGPFGGPQEPLLPANANSGSDTLEPNLSAMALNTGVPATVSPSVAGPANAGAVGYDSPAAASRFAAAGNASAQSNPIDKTATTMGVPQEIDVAPTAPTVTAILPPIDPSVGPIPPAPGEGSVAFEKTWSEVQAAIRNQDLVTALRTLSPWSANSNVSGEQRSRCFRMLDELAGGVIYSRQDYLEPRYTVQAGETLEEISMRYNVPQELLAKINGVMAPYALSTGENLKVIKGPFRAEISISQKQLTLYAGPYYAGRFNIEIGPDLPPEEAFYEVAEKLPGRNYFDRRSGTEVLRGQPGNRYGAHWIGLRGEHITTGHSVGIHGRGATQASGASGCVSLDQLDASHVFAILSLGSRVQIRR